MPDKVLSRPEFKVLGVCLTCLLFSIPAYNYYHIDMPVELAGILFLAVTTDPWWAAVGGLILATVHGLLLRIDYFYFISVYIILGLYWGYGTRLGLARIFGPPPPEARRKCHPLLYFLLTFVLPSTFIYTALKVTLRLLLFKNPGYDYSEKLFYFWSNYLITWQIIPAIGQAFLSNLPFLSLLLILGAYLIHKLSPTPYLLIDTRIDKQDMIMEPASVLWYLFGLMFSLVCFLMLETHVAGPLSQIKLLNFIHAVFFWEVPLMVLGVLAYLLATRRNKAGYILSIFITMLPPVLIIWIILRLESEINLNLRTRIQQQLTGNTISYPQLSGILDIYLQKQVWLIGLVTIGIFSGIGIILFIIYRWNKDIRTAKEELEQKVIERTQKLEQAQEKLIQTEKLAILGRLAAEVAHEVNNPLYGVINYADIAHSKSKELPTLRHYLEFIRSGLYYISAILKQLGSIPATADPKFCMVEVRQVLEQALFLMDYKITTQRIEIEKLYQDGVGKIEADPQLLQQVFINLIHNALQAMKENGKLTIGLSWLDGDKLRIMFSDTGQGIPPEYLGDIFKPFFTTKRAVEGMGLGLTVCRNFIHKHHGDISVQSQVGQGTTFHIDLPVKQ